MITLEQVRQLEKRVHQAVSSISALKGENTLLKQKLSGYETRIIELESRLSELKDGQSEIERGILAALDQLDSLEDAMFEEPASPDVDEQFIASKPSVEKTVVTATSTPEPAPADITAEAPAPEVEPSTPLESDTEDQQSTEELDIF